MAKTYEEGVRDGAINALKETQIHHEKRLNSHSGRLSRVEKMLYVGIGGLIVLQALPLIQQVLKAFG